MADKNKNDKPKYEVPKNEIPSTIRKAQFSAEETKTTKLYGVSNPRQDKKNN